MKSLIIFLLCISCTFCQINEFLCYDSDWNNTTNWSQNRLPSVNDTVIINSCDVLYNSNMCASIGSLIIMSANLTITGDMVITNDLTNNGCIKVLGNLNIESSNDINAGQMMYLICGNITLKGNLIINDNESLILNSTCYINNIINYGELIMNPYSVLHANNYTQTNSDLIIYSCTSQIISSFVNLENANINVEYYNSIGYKTSKEFTIISYTSAGNINLQYTNSPLYNVYIRYTINGILMCISDAIYNLCQINDTPTSINILIIWAIVVGICVLLTIIAVVVIHICHKKRSLKRENVLKMDQITISDDL